VPPRLAPPAHANAHANAQARAAAATIATTTTATAPAAATAAAAAGWALGAPATPRAASAASVLHCASRVARRFAKALAPRVDELAYAVEARWPHNLHPTPTP
jgi:predicted TPR repeat methyltransferase